METNTYPKVSVLPVRCKQCKEGKPESGGYKERKHRDLEGSACLELDVANANAA